MWTHLLTSDKEPIRDQSNDGIKVQIGEPVKFFFWGGGSCLHDLVWLKIQMHHQQAQPNTDDGSQKLQSRGSLKDLQAAQQISKISSL